MDILNLGEARAKRDAKEREMVEAIRLYRETITDDASTRDEIREACNQAIRKAVDLINYQSECMNALVTAGQILWEHVTGKTPKPSS